MTIEAEIHPTAQDAGRALAATIADAIAAARTEGRRYRLGCPTGRTPAPVYAALVAEVAARDLPLDHLDIVLMDDYVALDGDGRPHRVDPALPYSCEGVTTRTVVEPLRAAARGASGPQLWLPDVDDPGAYDQRILDAGGIDLFILASGASDGHIAFNPPGSPRSSGTRVIELAEATRRDNLSTFPEFGGRLENVPTHGLSVGIATIADQSHRVAMLLHGPEKTETFRRIVAAEAYEPDWPATILAECSAPRLLVDRAAAGSHAPAARS